MTIEEIEQKAKACRPYSLSHHMGDLCQCIVCIGDRVFREGYVEGALQMVEAFRQIRRLYPYKITDRE